MEEGPHDDILGVIDRNKFLWLQNHETDFIYACWFPACLRPLLLYFLLPLNSQQNYNHWTAVFFGSSHHILPAICEITDPVCTIGRHKKTARLALGHPWIFSPQSLIKCWISWQSAKRIWTISSLTLAISCWFCLDGWCFFWLERVVGSVYCLCSALTVCLLFSWLVRWLGNCCIG